MGNPEKTEWTIKNGKSRENRKGNQELSIQRNPKGKSRMGNPEKTEGAIKNCQSRENRRSNQEWAIQRKPMGQSRLGNPEMLARVCTQSTGRTQTKQKTQHRKLKR